jgi:hypothetical protein
MVFLLISCIVFLLVAYWIPKKLSQFEQYTVILFSILLGLLTDVLLDIKYHLYGYISPGVQYAGFLPILILFPVSGVVFINFFPFKKSFPNKFFYIFGWTIFSLFFEYLSVLSGYFYHNGWNYLYSTIAYPLLLLLHLLHFKFLKNLKK